MSCLKSENYYSDINNKCTNLELCLTFFIYIWLPLTIDLGYPDNSFGKEFTWNAEDPSLIPGLGKSPGEEIGYPLQCSWNSLVAQLVKNPYAMWKTWVRSLGWEHPLEKKALQYFGLENSMDCIVKVTQSCPTHCDCIVHGVSKSLSWLSEFYFHLLLINDTKNQN